LPKRKKKRNNKPAKKIESGKPIDPERWIPKQERSYYKGKRRGKVTGNKGAQGAVAASTIGAGEKQNTAFEEFDEKPNQKLTPQQIAQQQAAATAEAVKAAAAARGAKAGTSGPRGRRGGKRR